MSTETVRESFAQAVAGKVRSARLIQAFATVPREEYLGVGPWLVMTWDSASGTQQYVATRSADASELYHDVVVAIDPSRGLNNGQPSFLAFCLDALDLDIGERVLHIGCGVGYYTAIAAEVVGPTGSVVAVEIDEGIAARARKNLEARANVAVVHGDGGALSLGFFDAIFVNAGAAELKPGWLETLDLDGRMLVPLTTDFPNVQGAPLGAGKLLKLTRRSDGISAQFISGVAIYHCSGARDSDASRSLQESLARGDSESVRSLRRDPHDRDVTCWLHAESHCLSTLAPLSAGRGSGWSRKP